MSSFTRLRRKAVSCKCPEPAPAPSSDCIVEWKGVEGPFGKSYVSFGFSVAYGNGRWVAFGIGVDGVKPTGKNIYWSDDGINWTFAEGAPPDFSGVNYGGGGVAFGNGRWVAVGGTLRGGKSKNIYYSADGINWTAAAGEPFGTGDGGGVAYNGTRWVAVGIGSDASGKNIWYSDDGILWKASAGEPFGNIYRMESSSRGSGVAYGNGKWVAVGKGIDASGDSDGKNIYWSEDGIHWNVAPGEPFGTGVRAGTDILDCGFSVAYDGKRWIAVGRGRGAAEGKNIYYSDDGIHWTPINGLPELFGVAYGDKWIAVGEGTFYSDDGITWKTDSKESVLKCRPLVLSFGVAYGNRWVIVGTGNGKNIWYSV